TEQKDYYSIIWPQLVLEEEKTNYQKKVDFGLIFIPNEGSDPYMNAKEFFWLEESSIGFRWGMGRRKITWSQLDSDWGLGVWQPVLAYNYLRPIEQGTLGLFFDFDKKDHKFQFSISPYTIPSQTAKISEQDGFVQSSNRWFVDPISDLGLNGVKTNIKYSLEFPSFMEIISHPSVATSYYTTFQSSHWWFRASLAYKPMNHLHLYVKQPTLKSSLTDSYIDVEVVPAVLYHSLATIESGFINENLEGYISLSVDQPENTPLEDVWLEMPTNKTYILGSKGRFRLSNLGWSRSFVSLAAFKIIDETGNDQGLVTPKDDSFSDIEITFDRYKFRDAVSLGIEIGSEKYLGLYGDIKMLKSFSAQGEALIANIKYSWTQQWQAFLELDVIGHDSYEGQSFFNKYRTNDSVSGGVKYVF
ncbi:MAG: hypothetical protein KDD50_00570, partial [Bdellovibrionales bacterium]|nr:hypothetical protein [Bdellovibrionales bacterium]